MRAEYLAAMLAGGARSLDDVGYSTRPYDEKAAYLGRVSRQSMNYAEVVFFRWVSEEAVGRIVSNVIADSLRWWRPIADPPKGIGAHARWKNRQIVVIERLTNMALAEAISPAIGNPQKAEWRAAQLGVTDRHWRRDYRDRYARITTLMNEWESEFLGKVNVNQREAESV